MLFEWKRCSRRNRNYNTCHLLMGDFKEVHSVVLTLRCVSSWLSSTPAGYTTVTSPFGSGRRKWSGSGTSSVVPFMWSRVTFSISHSWWVSASTRHSRALQHHNTTLHDKLNYTDTLSFFISFKGEIYFFVESLQLVRTTQSMGRVVDRKYVFWAVLLRIGAEAGPCVVMSIIRRRFMTFWMCIYINTETHTIETTGYMWVCSSLIQFKAVKFSFVISKHFSHSAGLNDTL